MERSLNKLIDILKCHEYNILLKLSYIVLLDKKILLIFTNCQKQVKILFLG